MLTRRPHGAGSAPSAGSISPTPEILLHRRQLVFTVSTIPATATSSARPLPDRCPGDAGYSQFGRTPARALTTALANVARPRPSVEDLHQDTAVPASLHHQVGPLGELGRTRTRHRDGKTSTTEVQTSGTPPTSPASTSAPDANRTVGSVKWISPRGLADWCRSSVRRGHVR
jgi:hypothetical protein